MLFEVEDEKVFKNEEGEEGGFGAIYTLNTFESAYPNIPIDLKLRMIS